MITGNKQETTITSNARRRDLKDWKRLESLAGNAGNLSIKSLFKDDPQRFEKFHIAGDGLLIDYSKQQITGEIFSTLIDLADSCEVKKWRDKMFRGEKINNTEKRAVLHTALRIPENINSNSSNGDGSDSSSGDNNNNDNHICIDGQDIAPQIHNTLDRIKAFSENIRSGSQFKHIVNIGIGGSDLGPHMANEALLPFSKRDIDVHYVSNVDASHLQETLRTCPADQTLFIVTSKTFTTQETMTNANSAKKWLREKLGKDADISRHFAAVTQNIKAARDFGINPDALFPMWDWVGGRYSLWSAVGLPLSISLGFDNFRRLLDGAHAMDLHFKTAPLEENMPVILAMIGIWNRTFLKHDILALLPYSQYLHKFPAYIQQLDMESNGKTVDRDGNKVPYPTGPVIFGEAGTNGQHAFYQLLHQGTTIIPCEFIAVINPEAGNDISDHQDKLLSNVIGQSKSLMDGKDAPEPQKSFEGNRPSTTIMIDRLDPYHLGMLLALYEHKIFVQGIIWNLNSFDQWGVELGKKIAGEVLKMLTPEKVQAVKSKSCDEDVENTDLDSSTKSLISYVIKARNNNNKSDDV